MYVHLQQKDHGFWGSPSFLTIKQIKHLKTPKSFIPQRIQNHFSCFAPSGGSVFPLNSSTCSTANSPFVSLPVLSKPAERIKGLRFFQCSDYRFFCHDSFLLKKIICLKQPNFNALPVFTLLYWKKHYVFLLGKIGVPLTSKRSIKNCEAMGTWFFLLKVGSDRPSLQSSSLVIKNIADQKYWFALLRIFVRNLGTFRSGSEIIKTNGSRYYGGKASH